MGKSERHAKFPKCIMSMKSLWYSYIISNEEPRADRLAGWLLVAGLNGISFMACVVFLFFNNTIESPIVDSAPLCIVLLHNFLFYPMK